MNKEFLVSVRPVIELIYSLMDEVERKEKELTEVQAIARRLTDDSDTAVQLIGKLKSENHALQLFIEEHVDEEKKKLIFK